MYSQSKQSIYTKSTNTIPHRPNRFIENCHCEQNPQIKITYRSVSIASHMTPFKKNIITIRGQNVRRDGVTLKRSESPTPPKITLTFQSPSRFGGSPKNKNYDTYSPYYTYDAKIQQQTAPKIRLIQKQTQISNNIQSGGKYEKNQRAPYKQQYFKDNSDYTAPNTGDKSDRAEQFQTCTSIKDSKITNRDMTMAQSMVQSKISMAFFKD